MSIILRTPLMMAVLADRLEITQLIFKKAQKLAAPSTAEAEGERYLEIKDKGGRTALHCAAHKVKIWCPFVSCTLSLRYIFTKTVFVLLISIANI